MERQTKRRRVIISSEQKKQLINDLKKEEPACMKRLTERSVGFFVDRIPEDLVEGGNIQLAKIRDLLRRWSKSILLFEKWSTDSTQQLPSEYAMQFEELFHIRQIRRENLDLFLKNCVKEWFGLELDDTACHAIMEDRCDVGGCFRKAECVHIVTATMHMCWLRKNVRKELEERFTESFLYVRRRARKDGWLVNEDDFRDDCQELWDAQIIKDAEQMEIYRRYAAWQRDKTFLASLNLHWVIAKHIRAGCRAKEAGDSLDTIQAKDFTLDSEALTQELLATIRENLRRRKKHEHEDAEENPQKFDYELKFLEASRFHDGLEKSIGFPITNKDFMEQIKLEHEHGSPFCRPIDGREVNPKTEWNAVMKSEWRFADAGEPFPISLRDIENDLEYYVELSKTRFTDAGVQEKRYMLSKAEIAALRLWTGPMYTKYAELFRKGSDGQGGIVGPYVTTLHAINSGISKLARIWKPPSNRKVYRGYSNVELKAPAIDIFGCIGGVEPGVLATTEDFDIAVHYSQKGSFILEIDVGQVDRGADLSWLSQFPHEKEILFNAMSNLEFIGTPEQCFTDKGAICVQQVHINSNLKCKTLHEFRTLRRELHLNLVDTVLHESKAIISRKSQQNHIVYLHQKCLDEFKRVREIALSTGCPVFNEGGERYLKLVEDIAKVGIQAQELIHLVECWSAQEGINDITALNHFVTWQIDALKQALQTFSQPLIRKADIVGQQCTFVPCLLSSEYINLSDNLNIENVLKPIGILLSWNTQLTNLKLFNCGISAAGWDVLLSELASSLRKGTIREINEIDVKTYLQPRLQALHLTRGNDSVVELTVMKHCLPALTSLNLRFSTLGSSGSQAVSNSFSCLTGLKDLDLYECSIGDVGIAVISKVLTFLTSLEFLNFGSNGIEVAGAMAVAPALSSLTSLRDLSFFKNKIGNNGAEAICKNLTNSTNLQTLNLKFNEIDHCASDLLSRAGCSVDVLWMTNVDLSVGPGAMTLRGTKTCTSWGPVQVQLAIGWEIRCGRNDTRHSLALWSTDSENCFQHIARNIDVTCVTWSPIGDRFASASTTNSIEIWDTTTWKAIMELEGHEKEVNSVAWSPKGDKLASGSDDRSIIIWDTTTGAKLRTLNGHGSKVTCVVWHPRGDEEQLASCSFDRTMKIWNVKAKPSEEFIRKFEHISDVLNAAWSPIEGRIASLSSGGLNIWKYVECDKCYNKPEYDISANCFAWSPDGTQLVSGHENGSVIVWNSMTFERVATLRGQRSRVFTVAWWFDPGSLIASLSTDGRVICWDVKPIDIVSNLTWKCEEVRCVTWSRNGQQIASASNDDHIKVWDSKTGKQVRTLQVEGGISVAWNPVDDRIASGASDGTVFVWNVESGVTVLESTHKKHSRKVNGVAWNSAGDLLASCSDDETIIVWNARTGNHLPPLEGHEREVLTVAWRPDSEIGASGSCDCERSVIVWNLAAGYKIKALAGHTSKVLSVTWSSNGNYLASSSVQGKIIVWRFSTVNQIHDFEPIYQPESEDVMSIMWSPTRNQLALSSKEKLENCIRVLDPSTWEVVSVLKGHSREVGCIAWSPHGDKIVSGTRGEGIFVWNLKF